MSNQTEFPKALTASVKGTFAYYTIKDRLPVTITKAIDNITRFRNDLIKRYSEAVRDDSKICIEKLAELRYELTTDKPLRKVNDCGEDLDVWNRSLDELVEEVGLENCTWFRAPWLYTECYIYRRIREAMLACSSDLKNYDPFEHSKLETHENNETSIFQLITALCPLDFENEKNDPEILKSRFKLIMEALLWANKNDLSLSSGQDVSSKVRNLIELLDSFQENILCDERDRVWDLLLKLKTKTESGDKNVKIDIVLDNCAIELTSDLILCDFLLRNNFVSNITLHAKAYSWFISDVTKYDFDFLMRRLESSNSLVVNKFVKRLKTSMSDSVIRLEHQNPFWTTPYSLDKMKTKSPQLYNYFRQESSLVFLKGDLNYRKLIGDLDWPFDTELKTAARDFDPTNICALRTIKADLVAGLDIGGERFLSVEKKFEGNRKWMITGDYGLIQLIENS